MRNGLPPGQRPEGRASAICSYAAKSIAKVVARRVIAAFAEGVEQLHARL